MRGKRLRGAGVLAGVAGVGTLRLVFPVLPSATMSSMFLAVNHFVMAVAVQVVNLECRRRC